MIEVRGLTKRYGDKVAVDDLTFTVRPGIVTGFLGPNGAGKSTTMRLILGLDAPTRGSATVNGKPYREHAAPLREVGALLEARSVHPGRSVYSHLLALAQTNGIRRSRVDEVVDAVGLVAAAARNLVRVRSTDPDALGALLRSPDVTVSAAGDGALNVSGLTTDQVGTAAGPPGSRCSSSPRSTPRLRRPS